MANGTLKVGTLTTSSGSGNITIGSGVTLKSNIPAFEAHLSSSQALTDVTLTKVQFDSKIFDTDNCYSTSTYKFTPNKAGKYFVYSDINADPLSTAGLVNAANHIYKNGSDLRNHEINFNNNYARRFNLSVSCVIDMNGTTDYLEIYVLVNDTSGNPQLNATPQINNLFGAYRIGA
tara:strand:- start:1143 stop:1670 length:528 start_codon:yes stop_codon:yes gene_type:complete